MAATLDELEKRLIALEQAVAALRQQLEHGVVEETPAERGARMLRDGRASQPRLAAAWAKAMEEMGIRGDPIPAEQLQEMMIAEGITPEDNEFSRELIAMREE